MRKLILLAVAVMALSACEPTINKEVLFVGDSVIYNAAGHIVAELNQVEPDDPSARYSPNLGSVIAGQGLTKINQVTAADANAYWSAHLQSLVEHTKPEVIIVELGYNDCRNLASYGARIDNFMAQLGDTPVHWLTLPDPKRAHTCDTTVNAALTAATSRWPNLSLLPYATVANRHPEWFTDNIHLTPDGSGHLADFIHQQLDLLYPS